MKRFIFVVGLLLIVGTFAFGQQKNAALEAKLIQLDKDWTAAELRGDMKAISMYIADDFWGTTTEGVVENKAQYLKGIKASKDTDVADEYSVRFFGPDVAVMTHRGTVKGEQNAQYRSTHVWVNRGGKWLIVAHHGSTIKAPEPAAKAATVPAETKKKPKIANVNAAPVAADSATVKEE